MLLLSLGVRELFPGCCAMPGSACWAWDSQRCSRSDIQSYSCEGGWCLFCCLLPLYLWTKLGITIFLPNHVLHDVLKACHRMCNAAEFWWIFFYSFIFLPWRVVKLKLFLKICRILFHKRVLKSSILGIKGSWKAVLYEHGKLCLFKWYCYTHSISTFLWNNAEIKAKIFSEGP